MTAKYPSSQPDPKYGPRPDPNTTVVKYANRRLYSLRDSAYITLNELHMRVHRGTIQKVLDHATGEDLTRQIFMQILLECAKENRVNLSHEQLREWLLAIPWRRAPERFAGDVTPPTPTPAS